MAKTGKTIKKKGAEKFKSISKTIQTSNTISIIIAVLVVTMVTMISSNVMIDKGIQKSAEASLNLITKEMKNKENNLRMAAQTISLNNIMINAVGANDRETIQKEIAYYAQTLKLDLLSVTDSKGIVIARSHAPEKFGDDISNQSNIKTALAGEINFEVERGTLTAYVARVGIPVKNEAGNIIGSVTVGHNLENPEFLDEMKAVIGSDFSVFLGDERINTTVLNDKGERALGSKLSPEVVKTVFEKKEIFNSRTLVAGKKYIAAYIPIISKDGVVTGAIGTGTDMTPSDRSKKLILFLVILMALISVVISRIITSLNIKKKIKDPLQKVLNVAEEISVGNINTEVKVDVCNEMGQLSKAFNKMIQGIKQQADVALAISKGDLTVEYTPVSEKDVMGNALIKSVHDLNNMISAFRSAAEQVNKGASQLSDSSMTLSKGATDQASSIEQLASTIDNILEQVKENASSTSKAKDLVLKANKEVQNGNNQMDMMINAMSEIDNSSSEISKIIKVIDDIAFQTNILALNAAVEAARAGAAGKGFAVVADEVRNLAGKSAQAAKNTTSLIENSINKVKEGTKIANDTAESLGVIVQSINEISDLVEKIDEASEQQSSSVVEVTHGIEQISNIVQANSATAEESAAASEQLSGQANMLADLIAKIKTREVIVSRKVDGKVTKSKDSKKPTKIDLDTPSKY